MMRAIRSKGLLFSAAALCFSAASVHATTLVFSDNFNSPDSPADPNANNTLAGRQSGAVAPLIYTQSNGNGGTNGVVSNALSLNSNNMPGFGTPGVSPSYDFATSPDIASAGGFLVSFDAVNLYAADTSITSGNWLSVSVGNTQANATAGLNVVNGTTAYGFIMRNNGGLTNFVHGGSGSNAVFDSAPANTKLHAVQLEVDYGSAGVGAGNSATARLTIDSVLQSVTPFTWTGSNNYLSLESYQSSRTLDDLSVTTIAAVVNQNPRPGGPANLVWGAVVSPANWDITSSHNWHNPGIAGSGPNDVFYNADNVTFDDTVGVQTTVNLTATVSPSSVTVNSNTNNYTFTGPGGIGGTGGFSKSGNSTLTITTVNSYTGDTALNAGTILLTGGAGSALGTGALVISSGATLQIGNGGATSVLGNSGIVDNGTFIYDGNAGNSYGGITGTGSVSMIGTGLLGLQYPGGSGNQVLPNTYSGGTTISAGQVYAFVSTSFGTGPVVVQPGGNIYSVFGNDIFPNNFTLSGNAVQAGGGSVTGISGTVTLAADTAVVLDGSATLSLTNTLSSSGASLTASGPGTLALGGNVNLGAGQINSATPIILNPAAGVITISSVIAGTATVTQAGPGNSILSAANTYSGDTAVNAGVLVLGPAGSVASTNINVNTGGILTYAAATGGATPFVRAVPNVLNINAGGTVTIAPPISTASRQTLVVNNANLIIAGATGAWTGTLDLNANEAVIPGGSLAQVTNQVASGYNAGLWTGTGITSSAAAGDTRHLTAVGVIFNDTGAGTSTPIYTTFDGATTADGDILVKYTYYGDANLDGAVDGSDYTKIDAGYNSQATATPLTGWQNGDFNYDGKIDGSDYSLIDNAFNTQGSTLGTNPAALIAGTASEIAAGSSSVPEPATLGLIGIGAIGLLGSRRRK